MVPTAATCRQCRTTRYCILAEFQQALVLDLVAVCLAPEAMGCDDEALVKDDVDGDVLQLQRYSLLLLMADGDGCVGEAELVVVVVEVVAEAVVVIAIVEVAVVARHSFPFLVNEVASFHLVKNSMLQQVQTSLLLRLVALLQ